MTEKKLTDEEIVKGLENWILYDCTAKQEDLENAIYLILFQTAEIERLTEENGYLKTCGDQFLADYEKAQSQVDELQAKNTELQARVDNLTEELDLAEETIARLKERYGVEVGV